MKQNKSGIIHLLPLILVGVLVVGISYVSFFTNIFTDSSNNITVNEEFAEVVDTSNWKTHTSEKIGFKIKVPTNLDFSEKHIAEDNAFESVSIDKFLGTNPDGGYSYEYKISVIMRPDAPTGEDGLSWFKKLLDDQNVTKVSELGGDKGYEQYLSEKQFSKYSRTYYFENESGVPVLFTVSLDTREDWDDQELKQILSTFEFTEDLDSQVNNESEGLLFKNQREHFDYCYNNDLCPSEFCKTGCNPNDFNSFNGGCSMACLPKDCIDFSLEECPKAGGYCEIKTFPNGETVCYWNNL